MADYIAMGRSNYFRVTDEDRWEELKEGLCGDYWDSTYEDDGKTRHVLCIEGSFDWVDPEDEFCDSNIDYFLDELQKIIPNGECFIFHEIGHEKFRYLVSEMVVVTKREIEWINLEQLTRDYVEREIGPNELRLAY